MELDVSDISESSKSSIEEENRNEQLEPSLSLSALLSNILGSDDFDCTVYEEPQNNQCPQNDNVFSSSITENGIQSCPEAPKNFDNSYYENLHNLDLQGNSEDVAFNEELIINSGPVEEDAKPPWNISESFNNALDSESASWKIQFNECLDAVQNIPYVDRTVIPAFDYEQYHQGSLHSSDEVLIPWAPSEQYNCPRFQYNVCDSLKDNQNSCYIDATPRIKAERLEKIVSIKFENSDGLPSKGSMIPAIPLEFQEYPNSGIHFSEAGILKNYSQSARVWGLTVEQWQTLQTTYRYYPTNGDTPTTYWQGGWQQPLDMPSSREASPILDPSNQISSDVLSPGIGSSNKASASKRVDGKRCGVCGDRALGYNFNAITCESCKAFFRRNALKNKEYRCPFNDECDVTAVTRRFCQRCRLRKCFEVGMKKEWIMTEEEKKKKRKKIQENRARKIGDLDSPSGGPSNTSSSFMNSDINECSEQSSSFEGEDESRSYLMPSSEHLPLPSKLPVTPSKPKAVVVGRVRVEENENKVRKLSPDSDVHVQKAIITDPICSILNSSPSHEIDLNLASYVTSSVLLGDSIPLQQLEAPQEPHKSAVPLMPLKSTVPQVQHKTASITPSDSLVIGLLRTQSRGSAEENTPSGCQTENEVTESLILSIKKEQEEEGQASCDFKFPEASNSDGVSPVVDFQNKFLFPVSSDPVLCDKLEPSKTENPSLNVAPRGFKFSIQEALNMIQPGCKDIRSSSSEPCSSSGSSVMDSILNTAISAEYSAFSLLINSHSSELNQAESIKITELLEASKGLNSPLCDEPNYKDLPNPSLINVINLTEIAIRRLIKMAKKISAFKTFCQEDQIALLKGGCAEMMILRSVSAYDPDKDVWKIQQDHERFKNIKLKILKAASGNVYEEHKRFILSFHPEWRQDTRIIALLAAIALFTPERPNVLHPQAVRHEQSSYLYLLKRYMECVYGGCVGKTNYLKLLEIISDLHILNEEHVKVFLEVNPQEVEPLLIEIFDLKQS